MVGPAIVAADGSVVVDDPINKTALTQAVSWLGSIAPPSVLNMGATESLGFFASGNAAFLRYYPSGLMRSEDQASLVRGQVDMADLPKGGPRGVTRYFLPVSAWGSRAIPAFPNSPPISLPGSPAQLRRSGALSAGFSPSRPALYEGPDLVATYSWYPTLRIALDAAVTGPAHIIGAKFDRASEIFSEAVHRALSHREPPSTALDEVAATLRRMSASWHNRLQ
jgi:trehalose/maltose transport system substrate-binding protein